MSIPLLLTATTNPGETINVTVNSVDDRCQQYLDTLEFYLEVGVFKKIIFAENSGDDLTFLASAQKKAALPQPRTLISSWQEMLEVVKHQEADPAYEFDTPTPPQRTRREKEQQLELEASIGDLAPTAIA